MIGGKAYSWVKVKNQIKLEKGSPHSLKVNSLEAKDKDESFQR